jgi:hypothetical protein
MTIPASGVLYTCGAHQYGLARWPNSGVSVPRLIEHRRFDDPDKKERLSRHNRSLSGALKRLLHSIRQIYFSEHRS